MEANTKKEVISRMKNNGTINYIQAHYVSLISNAVQGEDDLHLKSFPKIRQTNSYRIATLVALQYLREKSMDFSLSSAEAEIGNLTDFNNSLIDQLKIDKNGIWIHELLEDWKQNKAEILQKNKSRNKQITEETLKILNSNSEDSAPESDESEFETDQIEFSDISSNSAANMDI